MQNKIYIDAGSSSVKIYKLQNNKLDLLFVKSISFKKNYNPQIGFAEKDKQDFINLISVLKESHSDCLIKIFATAAFRSLSSEQKKSFIDEIFEQTGQYLNIIDHELENFYLQNALAKEINIVEPILLVNIGGGSTELSVVYENEAIEKININLGVASVLNTFEGINNEVSKHSLEHVVNELIKQLPDLKNKVSKAIYSGGELSYMKLANYSVEKNTLFEDNLHPLLISYSNFIKDNNRIFSKTTLKELENLMPENPQWMHGARACSALAQAIFTKYNIDKIIPSDANLIDGVIRQEFRFVTLSGSFRKHLSYIIQIRKNLIEKGIKVLSPRFVEPKNPGEEFVVFAGEEGLSPLDLERHHLEAIEKSDALIVCDPNGYVGASALIEIGIAQSLGKRIIFTEKPEEFMLNTLPSEIGL